MPTVTSLTTGLSSIANLTNVNGTLFFTADDGSTGVELWKSDGTVAGTVRVKDINLGLTSSSPTNLTNVNGTLFFAANGSTGIELWKSDGTDVGTVLVKDINSGGDSSPANLTNANGTLFFRADDGSTGSELWKSDGTVAGTVRVKDINSGFSSSAPTNSDLGYSNFAVVNSTVYFAANDGSTGVEIWKSDGTDAGTVLVQNIRTGAANSNPYLLTSVNNTLFFTADNGSTGVELWKSDGSSAGTVQVRDVNGGINSSNPLNLTNVNGTLFFSATSTSPTNLGTELWKSDGTSVGTSVVRDIFSGSSGSSPSFLTNVNGTLFFRANDGTTGIELWKSDGSNAGTVRVSDINSGVGSSTPTNLINLNSNLFFTANNGSNGTELWKSDGTGSGTVLTADINVGASSSSPSNLTNINTGVYSGLYFTANDGTSTKLFKYNDWIAGGLKDFDGDGKADIVWNNPNTGQSAIWEMNGASLRDGNFISGGPALTADFAIAGVGDFGNDSKSDILWRSSLTGQNLIWQMNDFNVLSSTTLNSLGSNWIVGGVGDFGGDGKADILWRDTTTGDNAIWQMNGGSILAGNYIPVAPLSSSWSVGGVGDFNGDSKSDILWRNSTTGENLIWQMDGFNVIATTSLSSLASNWIVGGVGDFGGDGIADILWRDTTTGDNAIWQMSSANIAAGNYITENPLSSAWSVAGVGDLGGDGKADIHWRNSSTGQNLIWQMNGFNTINTQITASLT